VQSASVPKTPVDKNGHSLFCEDKIRFSKQSLSSTPAGNAMRSEEFGELDFRIAVT
jgi:hypothetical protein